MAALVSHVRALRYRAEARFKARFYVFTFIKIAAWQKLYTTSKK